MSQSFRTILYRTSRIIRVAIHPWMLASFYYFCPCIISIVSQPYARLVAVACATKSCSSVFKLTATIARWPAASCVSARRSWR